MIKKAILGDFKRGSYSNERYRHSWGVSGQRDSPPPQFSRNHFVRSVRLHLFPVINILQYSWVLAGVNTGPGKVGTWAIVNIATLVNMLQGNHTYNSHTRSASFSLCVSRVPTPAVSRTQIATCDVRYSNEVLSIQQPGRLGGVRGETRLRVRTPLL